MATLSSRQAGKALERAIAQAVAALEREPNLLTRARVSAQLAERMRDASKEFADQRSAAMSDLRDEGWSLADLKAELGIARARISQVINREDYRAARRARGRT